jgi:hypothetical protein
MFRSRKAKIVSIPIEEVLEVVEAIVEEAIEPEPQSVSNIEFLTVTRSTDGVTHGTLTDYDGNVYNYSWDEKPKRIMRLTGAEINKLTWDLCNDVLNKYFVKPTPPKVEEPIGPQIEQVINKALNPVSNAFKTLETKVEKALTARPAPAPAPVQAPPAPRPQTVQSVPTADAPAMSVADDDISINAMRFLQQSSDAPDLGIDYMSL